MHDVFISYSRKDVAFARRLETALKNYKPPKELKLPARNLNVFRDEEDFTGVEYFTSLDRHLGESSKLIVICSPNARASHYVDDEIRRFAKAHGPENIVSVLVAGIPNNEVLPAQEEQKAYPEALCEVLSMPLSASFLNFNARKDRVDRGAYLGSWYTLLANVYNLSRADLEQRDRRRRIRTRRIWTSIAVSIIFALSVALGFALYFWRDAVKEQQVALKEQHLAEDATALAVQRQKDAELQKQAAQQEAVEARQQTAIRLAAQALENLEGRPEKALSLALDGVDTFWSHRDPLVMNAVGALNKIMLGFGGSRPLLPSRRSGEAGAADPTISWAAAIDETGAVIFGPPGSDRPRQLSPPAGALETNERWSNGSAHLLFSNDRLVAARCKGRGGSCSTAVLWYWRFSGTGIKGVPVVLGKFPVSSWDDIHPVLSPNGRWLAWTNAEAATVRSLDTPSTLSIRGPWVYAPVFTKDSRALLVDGGRSIHRVALNDDGAPPVELSPLETSIRDVLKLDAYPHAQPVQPEPPSKLQRLAAFGTNGAVEWWDLSEPMPARRAVPNLLSSFNDYLQVYGFAPGGVRGSIDWSPDGSQLLGWMAETSGEFGFGAVHSLETNGQWRRLLQHYEAKNLTSSTNVRNDTGRVTGFKVKAGGELGLSSAMWVDPGVLLTLGFDGSVLLRILERPDGEYLQVATGAASMQIVGKYLVTGGNDGRLRFIDIERDDHQPDLTLNGHDAPVLSVRGTSDLERILSTDSNAVSRVWSLSNPILLPEEGTIQAEGNWTRVLRRNGSDVVVWPIPATGAPWPSQNPSPANPAQKMALSPDGLWKATLGLNASNATLVIRLWLLSDEQQRLKVERHYAAPAIDLAALAFRLAVNDSEARVLLFGNDYKTRRAGAWRADLFKSETQLRGVSGDGWGLELADATRDLTWAVGNLAAANTGGSLKAGPQLVDLRKWDGVPALLPIEGPRVTRIEGVSSDGRWLVVEKPGGPLIVDLSSAAASGSALRWSESASSIGLMLGRHQPPVILRTDGTLSVWNESARPGVFFQTVLKNSNLGELAWDDCGEWLALRHRDGRVWLARSPAAGNIEEFRHTIETAMRGTPLPAPLEAEDVGLFGGLFPFPALGWVVAGTEKNVWMWHRDSAEKWEPPLVISKRDLHLTGSLYSVRFRPDGGMAMLNGQLITFDPEGLMAQARRLLSGRPQPD
jgi:WD40 repeat protein